MSREIDRETKRVVKLEDGLAVEHLVLAVERAFEHFHAVLERLREALLFLLEDLRDALLGLHELGIGVAHRFRQRRDDFVEERFRLPELVAVPYRAANNSSEHVTAALVARNDAVDDQERARADVIGDHVQRIAFEVFRAGLARGGLMRSWKRSIS